MTTIETLEDFKKEVDRIDWWACMSDSYAVAVAGEAHHKKVLQAMAKFGPQAKEYYDKQCPYGK